MSIAADSSLVPITVRLTPALLAQLEQAAADNERTVAAEARVAIRRYLSTATNGGSK